MKKEYLIKKWLDNDLNADELVAFKALDDYDVLLKISDHTTLLETPAYQIETELDVLKKRVSLKKKGPSKNWLSPVLKIAALFVVCFGLYQFTNFNSDPTFNTEIAQKDKIELPDHSIVTLNALSSIDFDKEQWNSDRNVSLKGEAFFDVEKGATFNVNTKHGVITVYGTEFNVKARNNYFEVICYEGLVGVSYSDEEIKLNPGDSFLVIDNIVVVQNKSKGEQPSWLNNESTFNSIPYKEVIAEFERQYDINIVTKSVDLDVLFTGGFSHTDIETSLKSITLPLQLTYIKKGNTITIKRD